MKQKRSNPDLMSDDYKASPGTRCRFRYYYTVPILSIFFAMFLKVMDRGPLVPPFPPQFTSIDCHSVKFEQIYDKGGQIDVLMRASPSVEYPPQYLPNFISLNVKTGPSDFVFSGEFIRNITRDDHFIKFSIQNVIAGRSSVKAKCLNQDVGGTDLTLKDIKIFDPDWSFEDDPGNDVAKMHRVCLEYEKFLFFIKNVGNRPAVPHDASSFRFEFLKMALPNYLDHKKVQLKNGTFYMVAPLAHPAWKQILLSLAPLDRSITRNQADGSDPILIMRGDPGEEEIRVLQQFSKTPVTKLEPIHCFETLMMTSTLSKDDYNAMDTIMSHDFSSLRARFFRNMTISNKVTVSNTLSGLAEMIKTDFPLLSVNIIDQDMPLQQSIEMVSSSQVFISDHISSLIHLIWMNKANTTVIDVTPETHSCSKWTEKLAKPIGINYVSLYPRDSCPCSSFKCLSEQRPHNPHSVKEAVYNQLKKALNLDE